MPTPRLIFVLRFSSGKCFTQPAIVDMRGDFFQRPGNIDVVVNDFLAVSAGQSGIPRAGPLRLTIFTSANLQWVESLA